MAERPSDKSPDAFRTISEVADHLDLPQHVLRFWETKFSEIRPVKRAGGRRFYRPDDIDLLRAIRHLLYSEGYTIKGVQRILKDHGPRYIQAMGGDLLEGRAVAPPAKLAPEAPAGAGRSGILGLLPRRKERPPAQDPFEEPGVPEPLFTDEPPLPPLAREPQFDAFLPGFEATVPRAQARAVRHPTLNQHVEPDAEFDDEEREPPYEERSPPREALDVRHNPPLMTEKTSSRPAPPVQRPTRGPASRVPDASPLPELEDPLLPFFDDDTLAPPVDNISEPLDARIRRLKEHVPPPGPPEEYIPARARRRAADEPPQPPRVGPLTGVFDDLEESKEAWIHAADDEECDGHPMPPEPRRHGPPEQYLPPHLRSEPRLAAAVPHPPQPILSREDVNRLQAALYELGECRRLMTTALEREPN